MPTLWVGQSIREETESGVGVSTWLSLGSWRAPWPASHELSPITVSANGLQPMGLDVSESPRMGLNERT